MACPNCDSPALPSVVVRSGVGIWNPVLITSLHCPDCHSEWTEELLIRGCCLPGQTSKLNRAANHAEATTTPYSQAQRASPVRNPMVHASRLRQQCRNRPPHFCPLALYSTAGPSRGSFWEP